MSSAPKSFDPGVLASFPAIFDSLKARGLLTPVMTIKDLKESLSHQQADIVERIFNLNPQDYGVMTPYAGDLENVPADLVVVSGQRYVVNGERKILGDKYVPLRIHRAYLRMNTAFQAEHPDRPLLIGSCYRSPAYQIVIFINWLIHDYDDDIAKTIRHASPPTYSQHTIASKAAIDFANIDGSPSDKNPEDFKDTPEYSWLRQHANNFGFYESWVEGNEFGMQAEPWHWQFLGNEA